MDHRDDIRPEDIFVGTSRPARQSGFTLIELLVAMAIGILVLLTLVATFRAVVGTIQATTRLAQENALTRQGMILALEEVDFWRLYDNPDVPSQQGLRAMDATAVPSPFETGSQRGLPFTPFRDLVNLAEGAGATVRIFDPAGFPPADANSQTSQRANATSVFTTTGGLSGPHANTSTYPPDRADPGGTPWPMPFPQPLWQPPLALPVPPEEFARGWRSDYHWAAVDERTWFHGNGGETLSGNGSGSTPGVIPAKRSSKLSGRYAAFENVKTVPVLGDPNAIASSFGPTGDFGPVEARHSWRANQIMALRHALGYFGWADYLPSNVVGCTYLNVLANGTIDVDEAPHTGWSRFPHLPDSGISGLSYASTPSHLFRAMRMVTVTCFPRSPYGFTGIRGSSSANVPIATMAGNGHNTFANSWQRGITTGTGMTTDYYFADWLYQATVVKPLLPVKPNHWPDLDLSISRWMTSLHFFAATSIRWTNAATGKVGELSINGYGTTLRGARQQRHRDGGWARWYAPQEDLDRIAAGWWYDRVINPADGMIAYVLVPAPSNPLARPATIATSNDPTLDDQ